VHWLPAIGFHLLDLGGIDARLPPFVDAARLRIRYSFKLAPRRK